MIKLSILGLLLSVVALAQTERPPSGPSIFEYTEPCSEMYAAANLAASTSPYSLVSARQDSDDGPELTAKDARDKSAFTVHFETPRNTASQIKCIVQIPHRAEQNDSVRQYVDLIGQKYQMLNPKPK